MEENINLICPKCNTRITFAYVEGFATKNIRCPKCSYVGKSSSYFADGIDSKDIDLDKEDTPLYDVHTKSYYIATDRGRVRININNINTAKIFVESTGESFDLKHGSNIIGRYSESSVADIQIKKANDKTMSRKNAEILQVKDVNGITKLYLCEINSLNPIQLNGKEVTRNSKTEIHNGDKITLGKTVITIK